MKCRNAGLFFLLLAGACGLSEGVVLFREDFEAGAELGEDFMNPMRFTVQPGENEFIGRLNGGTSDLDLFNLIIPDGLEISSLKVLAFSGGDTGSFLGGRPGPTLGASPFDFILGDAMLPINFVLLSSVAVNSGQNLLPQFVVGAPINGAPTLREAEYSFWLNENTFASEYHFSFGVRPIPVPEPRSSALLMIAALGAGLRFRKR